LAGMEEVYTAESPVIYSVEGDKEGFAIEGKHIEVDSGVRVGQRDGE